MEARPKRVTFAQAPLQIIDGDRGKAYPSRQEFKTSGYCLFLNTGNVTKQGFDFSSCDYISEERDRLLRKGRVLRGDIVLTTRGTVGNVAFFDEHIEIERIRINSGMVIFRCDVAQLLPDYLFHFLRSRDFEEQVLSLVTGSAQPQLPIKDIQQIEIPIPSLADQERIVSIINSFEQRLLSNRRSCRILEEMSQTLFKSWFVDFDPVVAKSEGRKPFGMSDEIAALFPDSFEESELGAVPKGWRIRRLGEVSDLNWGNTSITKASYSQIGYPAWSASGQDGLLPHFENEGTGVIVSAIGAYCGRSWLTRGRWTTIKNTLRYWSVDSSIPTEYLFLCCSKPDSWEIRGSAQPFISQGDARDKKIIIPEKSVLSSFAKIVCPMFEKIHSSHEETRTLTQMRDLLLPELLNGNFVRHLFDTNSQEATAA